MKTVVINLLGGSGLGKSTTAALLFGELKLNGVHSELVREFVKEWAWQGRKPRPEDQTEIYETQKAREQDLYGKVDIIVTDSPLYLCAVYQKFYTGSDPIAEEVFRHYAESLDSGVRHINILLKRNKPFDPRGRYETEDQAKQVDSFLEEYLKAKDVPYVTVTSNDKQRVQDIITLIKELVGAQWTIEKM